MHLGKRVIAIAFVISLCASCSYTFRVSHHATPPAAAKASDQTACQSNEKINVEVRATMGSNGKLASSRYVDVVPAYAYTAAARGWAPSFGQYYIKLSFDRNRWWAEAHSVSEVHWLYVITSGSHGSLTPLENGSNSAEVDIQPRTTVRIIGLDEHDQARTPFCSNTYDPDANLP